MSPTHFQSILRTARMTDIFSKEKRSAIMRSIKSVGNASTELKLINIFRIHSIKGWRRNYAVIGKPDFVFPRRKIAVFVDGCFWHGHHCRNTTPKQNRMYWLAKIGRNRSRDQEITKIFEIRGWKVIRIWECELRKTALPVKLEILKSIDVFSAPKIRTKLLR